MTGACHAKNGGVLPVTGFPRVDGMANEEEQLRFTGEYNNQPCISYNTCMRRLGVIPSERAKGTVLVRGGK